RLGLRRSPPRHTSGSFQPFPPTLCHPGGIRCRALSAPKARTPEVCSRGLKTAGFPSPPSGSLVLLTCWRILARTKTAHSTGHVQTCTRPPYAIISHHPLTDLY